LPLPCIVSRLEHTDGKNGGDQESRAAHTASAQHGHGSTVRMRMHMHVHGAEVPLFQSISRCRCRCEPNVMPLRSASHCMT
jgi:hypothetical protein